MECFLFEMWEDLGVKLGERRTYSSPLTVLGKDPAIAPLRNWRDWTREWNKRLQQNHDGAYQETHQFCCLRRETSRGSSLVSSMLGRAWPPPSSLYPSPTHKLPSQPAISLPTALAKAPLSLSFLCPCSKLPSMQTNQKTAEHVCSREWGTRRSCVVLRDHKCFVQEPPFWCCWKNH